MYIVGKYRQIGSLQIEVVCMYIGRQFIDREVVYRQIGRLQIERQFTDRQFIDRGSLQIERCKDNIGLKYCDIEIIL